MNRIIVLVVLLTTVVWVGMASSMAPLQAQETPAAAPADGGKAADPAAGGQDAPQGKEAPEGQAPRVSFLQSPMFMIMIIFALFYFIMLRPGQRKEKGRNQRVTTIEKNSQVITRGGIIGKVVSVNEDRHELTILTDEKTDTRLKISRSGIWDLYDPIESVENK